MSTLTLQSILTLPKSSRYANPKEANAILPIIYGDMTEGSEGFGVWKCPQIDTVNFVYCLAGHAILNADDNDVAVFDSDGNLVSATAYTVNTGSNYEGQGVVATLRFASDQGDIYAQCKGKIFETGGLITNPLDVIEDLILDVGTNIQQTVFNQARFSATALGYTCAGAILTEQTYAYWLNQICSTFLADWWINFESRFVVRLDVSLTQTSYNPAAFLRQRETTQISGMQNLNNLVNQVPCDYAVSYAQVDRRFKEGAKGNYLQSDDGTETRDLQSQYRYGIHTPTDVYTLDWTRNLTTVRTIQARIIEKFSRPQWVIQWTDQTFEAMHTEKGDFVVYSWEEQQDDLGDPLKNQFAQILEKSVDLDSGSITFSLRDTGVLYAGEVPVYDGTRDAGDDGIFGGGRSTIMF